MRSVQIVTLAVAVATAWGVARGQNVSVITQPDWLRKPTSDQLMAAFPTGAEASTGVARIACIVTVQGLLRNCRVTSETPAGQGFGAAALAIAPQFLMKPATRDGQPYESEVVLPIIFKCQVSCKEVTTGGKKLLQGVNWALAPSQTEMVAAYPPKAKAQHILGVASIQCEMTAEGSLHKCETMSEEPKRQGFGKAAISLAKYFQKPTNVAKDVKLDGAVTRLTFTFGEQMYDGAPYVAKPRYSAAPTLKEMMDAYRAAAPKSDEINSGEATVICKIIEAGALSDCKLLNEAPAGKGVGAAVLSVTPKFKIATWTEDGLPVIGTSVRLPVKFDIKDPPAVAPAKATNAP